MRVRKMQISDIVDVKSIADEHRDSLGFVLQGKIAEAIADNRGFVVTDSQSVVGFVIYRHRKADRQTTLSEIAVTSAYQKRQAGKLLLWQLEDECRKLGRTFIQLKCPSDLPANSFYQRMGYKIHAIQPGKKRELNVWRKPINTNGTVKLILCYGSNERASNLAQQAGWEYGLRDDYNAHAQPYMIDFDWQKPVTLKRWDRYLTMLRELQPYMAMVPDFEDPAQWPMLKKQILDVGRIVPRVMVTPKHTGAIDRIPLWSRFIIGISVPTEYAGYLPQPEEVAGRKLHFLGGSPDQWAYLLDVYSQNGATVVSADGNFAIRQARDYRKYFSAKRGKYIEMNGEGFDIDALALATLRNVRTYMQNPPPPASLIGNVRVQKCKNALGYQEMALAL